MKTKFTRILGVGLTIALLTSLMVIAAPASAASSLVIWGESNIPKTDDYVLGPAGIDVVDLAANGETIYAVAPATEEVAWEVIETATGTTDNATIDIQYTECDGTTSNESVTLTSAIAGGTGNLTILVRDIEDIALTSGWSSATAGKIAITGRTSGETLATLKYDDTFSDALVAQTTALYKSTDGGATWSSLHTSTYYPKAKSVKLVAVATDDENIVTIVTTDNYVYYSSNGGSSWSNLKNPKSDDAAVINDVDVSAGTSRYIVAAGTDGADAELYTMYLAMAQSWSARTGAGFVGSDSILAVKFSPNYAIDKIITVVSENGSLDAFFQIFWYEDKEWNEEVTGFETGYPVNLDVTDAVAASIALPATYLGNDEAERIAFVSVAEGTKSEVLRLIDYSTKDFQLWNGGDEGPVYSLAYNNSSEILLAGAYEDSKVYSCFNPMASFPKFERLNNLKQPGGSSTTASMVVVGWSGDNAVAGTSGDESAFAVSTDNGYAFNDISLIDTSLSVMDDVAVNADGSKVYLTSTSGTDASVWLKDGTWSRVLSLTGVTGTVLVRIAAEDDEVVYVAEQGTRNVWVSKDSGKGSWKNIDCYKLSSTDGIQDLAVASADVAYAMDSAGVSKTINAGASWKTKNSHKVAGHMITLAPNGDVLVGGSDGYMSWSTDGGGTFTKSTSVGSGNVQVVADSNYAENGKIYAGVGTSVKRSYPSGGTLKWSGRGPDLTGTPDWEVTGILQDGNVTYVLTSDGTHSRFYRALDLRTAATSELARWSYLRTEYGYPCQAEPQALRLSAGSQLWAIDTGASPALVSWKDPIATVGPTLTGPADGATIAVNPETGRAYNVTFTWTRFSAPEITNCTLQIATDAAFDGVIYEKKFTGINSDSIAKVVGPTGAEGKDKEMAEYMPGSTYFWRVKVDGLSSGGGSTLISEWSEARSFTVSGAVTFEVKSPIMGATDASITPTLTWSQYEGALSYEVEVSDEPTFVVPLISRNTEGSFFQIEEALAYATTYYWRVRGVTGVWVPKEETAGGPWVTGIFTTMGDPAEALPPIIIQKEPGEPAEVKVIEVPVQTPAPIPPALLWVVVVIGALLVVALIILIVRTRRVA